MTKILVTGANGFIGSALTKSLSPGYQFICADRKFFETLSDEALKSFVHDQKIKTVIHLASHFVRQHRSDDIAPLISSNISLGTRILEALRGIPEAWFLNTGSAWQNTGPDHNGPFNLYAATKEAFSDVLRWYGENAGINYVTLKLFDTYGPQDPRDKVLNLIHQAATKEETLSLSPGEQILDLSYIDDVVRAYLKVLEQIDGSPSSVSRKTFGVSGARVSLKELVATYEEVCQRKVPAKWGALPYRENEIMEPWTGFESLSGWRPQVSLKEGIRKTFT